MMYPPDDEWGEFLLTDSNLCLKHANRRRLWMRQLWESRTDGEYFKVCKIVRKFADKFRECYRMDIKSFDYIFDSMKDDLQGYSNFRKYIEAEEKLTVAILYVLVIAVRIDIDYICTVVNAIKFSVI